MIDTRRLVSVVLAVVVILLALASSCSIKRTPSDDLDEVVGQPEFRGEPGDLIGAQELDDDTDSRRVWRVAYHSKDLNEIDIAITGLVVTPEGDPPDGGWPLIAWAHPTTGTSDSCTPSLDRPDLIHLVDELIDAGFAIAATDYDGLGTDRPHPYLVGPSEGRAVLDAARAATRLTDTSIALGPLLLSGFSQGGHAALFAAEIAPEYAPEFDLLGVFAAAPVTDVASFAERAEPLDWQFGVFVTIVHGFASAYPELSLDEVLTEEALDLVDVTEEGCIDDAVVTYTQPVNEMLLASPLSQSDWVGRFAESLVGQVPIDAPVRIIQGTDDPIVFESVTAATVERMCAIGTTVEYVRYETVDHGVLTPERALPWILDRMAGRPAEETCTTDTQPAPEPDAEAPTPSPAAPDPTLPSS